MTHESSERRVSVESGEADARTDVVSGRWCAFPGGREGVRTLAFYEEFAEDVRGRRVVDVGAGSGTGVTLLGEAASLVGIDVSEAAVRFARAAAPRCEFLVADAANGVPVAEVVLSVDVLGHVEDPCVVLERIRDALPEGGLLCLAEPKASLAVSLDAPARRAFSERSLSFLLQGAGFRLRSLAVSGGFVVARAEAKAERTPVGRALATLARSPERAEEFLPLLSKGSSPERVARARILSALGRLDEAFEELLRAHREHGEEAEVLARLGALCLEAGATEDGLRFVAGALERDPTNVLGLVSLARAEGPRGAPDHALALWANAARLAPADVDVAVEFARCAALGEHYHLGTLALERVRRYHESLPADFYLTAGFLWALCGASERAAVECAHAEILAPGSDGVRELRAFLAERAAA